MTYSKNIVRLRQERNLSQEEVADAIGVTPAGAVAGNEATSRCLSLI